jgi:hypothetical protein
LGEVVSSNGPSAFTHKKQKHYNLEREKDHQHPKAHTHIQAEMEGDTAMSLISSAFGALLGRQVVVTHEQYLKLTAKDSALCGGAIDPIDLQSTFTCASGSYGAAPPLQAAQLGRDDSERRPYFFKTLTGATVTLYL